MADEPKALKKLELPSLPEDKLREFVLALCDNRIFSSAHMSEAQLRNLPMVFMPVGLGAFAEYDSESLKEIGIIYEYYDQAGPRSLNGMTMFTSFRMMNKADWERCREAANREMERRKEIPL